MAEPVRAPRRPGRPNVFVAARRAELARLSRAELVERYAQLAADRARQTRLSTAALIDVLVWSETLP